MRDLVLQQAPSSSFGPLKAILALYIGHHINDIITVVVSLREAKMHPQQKGIPGVARTSPVSQSNSAPVR